MMRDSRLIVGAGILLVVGFFTLISRNAWPQEAVWTPTYPDRVTLQNEDGSSKVLTGTIQSITGAKGMTILIDGGNAPESFPMTSVLDIETDRSPSHVLAEEVFKRGLASGNQADFSQALLLFREARQKEEKRNWGRQLLTARIVETLKAMGNPEQAASEFFLLCQTDPLTPYLASIPLSWGNDGDKMMISASPELAAWLNSETNPTGKWNPAGRLLAASLLAGSSERQKAQAALSELATLRNPLPDNPDAAEYCRSIALLASAQLWQLRLARTPSKEEVSRWEASLSRFPDSLAVGPMSVAARGLRQAGEKERGDALLEKVNFLRKQKGLPSLK